MTITYLTQVLEMMDKGEITDGNYITDYDGELQKAVRRARKRVKRLKTRCQYEFGEMDKAKADSTKGYMEKFLKYFQQIRNINFDDCSGLSGISQFLSQEFKMQDMIDRANKIASLKQVGSTAYSSMALGYGLLETVAVLPDISLDNKRISAMDKAYIKEALAELNNYQKEIRTVCQKLEDITGWVRDKSDALSDLGELFADGVADLANIIRTSGSNWELFSQPEKMQIGRAVQVAQAIMSLFPSLLDENGNMKPEGQKAIDNAWEILARRDA